MHKFLTLYILIGLPLLLLGQPSASIRYSILTEDSTVIYTPKKAKNESFEINVFWNETDLGFAGNSDSFGRVISYSPNDLDRYNGKFLSQTKVRIQIFHKSEKMEIVLAISTFGNYRLDSIPFMPGHYHIDVDRICKQRYDENNEHTLNGYHSITPFEWIEKREEDD